MTISYLLYQRIPFSAAQRWRSFSETVLLQRVRLSHVSLQSSLAMLTSSAEEIVRYLCPFCDQPLGPRVEEWFEGLGRMSMDTLPRLIASLWKKTSPHPRITNLQGRRVSEDLEHDQKVVCEQHRFETLILPISVQFAWTRKPNFYTLLGFMFQPEVESRLQWVIETPALGLMIDDPHLRLTSRDYKTLLDKANRLPLEAAG